MTPYKQLIYGVTIMLVGGATYYFHNAGVSGLISSGSGDRRGNGVSAAQVFSGTFLCDETSGCKNPIRLILEDDTTLDIIAIEEGRETSLGQGTWNVNAGGGISMALRNPGIETSDYPTTLIASKASSIKIAGFSTKEPMLPGMENPVFKRIKTEAELQAEQRAVDAATAREITDNADGSDEEVMNP